jgi:hypothetical protein
LFFLAGVGLQEWAGCNSLVSWGGVPPASLLPDTYAGRGCVPFVPCGRRILWVCPVRLGSRGSWYLLIVGPECKARVVPSERSWESQRSRAVPLFAYFVTDKTLQVLFVKIFTAYIFQKFFLCVVTWTRTLPVLWFLGSWWTHWVLNVDGILSRVLECSLRTPCSVCTRVAENWTPCFGVLTQREGLMGPQIVAYSAFMRKGSLTPVMIHVNLEDTAKWQKQW